MAQNGDHLRTLAYLMLLIPVLTCLCLIYGVLVSSSGQPVSLGVPKNILIIASFILSFINSVAASLGAKWLEDRIKVLSKLWLVIVACVFVVSLLLGLVIAVMLGV